MSSFDMNPEMMLQTIGFTALQAREWLFILVANQKMKLESARCLQARSTTLTNEGSLLCLLVFSSDVSFKVRWEGKLFQTKVALQRVSFLRRIVNFFHVKLKPIGRDEF